RGLGTHAQSDVRFPLDGTCTALSAQVGIDDEVGRNGSVTFEVWGNGTRLWNSPTVRGGSAPLPVNVALSQVKELRLVTTNAGDGANYDHADWADAQVACGATAGPPAPT